MSLLLYFFCFICSFLSNIAVSFSHPFVSFHYFISLMPLIPLSQAHVILGPRHFPSSQSMTTLQVLAVFLQDCVLPFLQVIDVHDCKSIYRVPLLLANQDIVPLFAKRLQMEIKSPRKRRHFMVQWRELAERCASRLKIFNSFSLSCQILLLSLFTGTTVSVVFKKKKRKEKEKKQLVPRRKGGIKHSGYRASKSPIQDKYIFVAGHFYEAQLPCGQQSIQAIL